MPVLEPPLPLPAAPRLSLPVTRRRLGPGALASLVVHAAIVGLLWQSAARLAQLGTGSAGGGGERPAVNFFALPAPAPAAVELPPTPRVQLTALPPLQEIKLDVPAIAPALESAAAPGGAASGGGGQGAGPGTGSAAGPGTGGGGDYIWLAAPRTAILPPLAKVPGSVAGRTYRIRFWVSADGRVTRVEVDPPIRDEAYRQELVQRMMAYQFNPARTRDGANVSSVVTVSLRIGN